MTESKIARISGGRRSSDPPPRIAEVIDKVRRHLRGNLQDFRDIALDLKGTAPFARLVYQAARRIGAGQITTYGALARAVSRPGAARAVGQALRRNPIGIIIPCHRVLAAGGRSGGFSAHGGPATKARMLAIEGVTLGPPHPAKSERDLRRAAAMPRDRVSRPMTVRRSRFKQRALS
jgi:methylated-DNA-[protein]-cysteine S-methyltransferase